MSRMTNTQAHSPQTPRDFRQEVTDSIIKLMEKGTAPWQRPWDASGMLAMPMNPTSGKNYRGGNAIFLLTVGLERGYTDPRWMTYKQAAERGWKVKKGERGAPIEFWDVKRMVGERPDDNAPDDEQDTVSKRLIHRIYTVFNAEQIAGIPALQAKKPTEFEIVAAGESILTSSGATIIHGGERAFYHRGRDDIHLPPREAFKDTGSYYGTAIHELAHWTGHPDRLNRPTLNESYRFGDTNYAKEELRAELASVFLSAERGIPHDTERHAAYVANWVKSLQEDKNEIFKAAADAGKAVDYLFALERGERPEKGKPAEIAADPVPPAAPQPTAPEPAAPATHAERVEKARTLTLDFGLDR